jgi:hypothetical protein
MLMGLAVQASPISLFRNISAGYCSICPVQAATRSSQKSESTWHKIPPSSHSNSMKAGSAECGKTGCFGLTLSVNITPRGAGQ